MGDVRVGEIVEFECGGSGAAGYVVVSPGTGFVFVSNVVLTSPGSGYTSAPSTAWGSGWTGISRVIVAVDSDLTTQRSPNGDRRDLAVGVETWWKQQRFGVRSGVSRSTVGEARAAVSSGVSAALTTGMYVDAHATLGERGQRGWGMGVRVLY